MDSRPAVYASLQSQLQRDADRNRRSARHVFQIVRSVLGAPASILDVGCATGEWLTEAHETFGPDVALHGIVAPWDSAPVHAPERTKVEQRDLLLPADLPPADLILCIEVAEHLTNPGPLLDALAKQTCVLFSAAIPGQGGHGHVHERWQSWWASELCRRGMLVRDIFRRRLWQTDVHLWCRQNLFLFVRPVLFLTSMLGGAGAARLATDHLDQQMPVDIVHPLVWENRERLRVPPHAV